MTVWSIDPGKRIGIAEWSEKGVLQQNHIIDDVSLYGWMRNEVRSPNSPLGHVTRIVMEDWKLRGGRAMQQTGSRMVASQVIGSINLFAYLMDVEIILQQPQAMKVAALQHNIKLPKGHIPDDLAAKLHGLYYFTGQGVLSGVSLSDRLSLDDAPGAG